MLGCPQVNGRQGSIARHSDTPCMLAVAKKGNAGTALKHIMESEIHASEQDGSNDDDTEMENGSEFGNKIVDTLIDITDISDVVEYG